MSDTPPPNDTGRRPRFNFGTLTKTKVAGIPVIYILLVVAAVALFMALRMKRATSDEPAVEDAVTDEVALPTYENPVFTAQNPQGGTVTTGGTDGGEGDSGVPDVEDPEPAGPVDAGGGDEPSEPIPAPTPPQSPVPAPVPAPAYKPRKQGTPGCWHTVEGGLDNGPGDLALLYYGVNNADAVNKIAAQNIERPRDGAGKWPVGTKLWIPPNTAPKYFKATSTVRSAPDIAAKNSVNGGGPAVKALNPTKNFPVAVGTSVRVD